VTQLLPLRRLVAYGVDSGVIVFYLLLVVPALVYGASWPWPGEPWRTQLLSLFCITLPVALYFALSDASRHGATLGKRVSGLRVVNLQENACRLRRVSCVAPSSLRPGNLPTPRATVSQRLRR
jgi:uncharacterized RDD family membrane protein YckC